MFSLHSIQQYILHLFNILYRPKEKTLHRTRRDKMLLISYIAFNIIVVLDTENIKSYIYTRS